MKFSSVLHPLLVTADGKVFACGEGTNGRLGLGSSANVCIPRQLTALSQAHVKKIAVHSGKTWIPYCNRRDCQAVINNSMMSEKKNNIDQIRSIKIRSIQ